MHVYGARSFLVAYACECRDGEVKLSHEHTAHRWTTVDDYVAHWCHPGLEDAFPQHAVWLRQVRRNCELVASLP